MDPTMMSVFGVGVSLAASLVVGQRTLRTEIAAVETSLGMRIDRLEDRVAGLDSRLSHLEGSLSALPGPFRRTPVPEPTPDESPA